MSLFTQNVVDWWDGVGGTENFDMLCWLCCNQKSTWVAEIQVLFTSKIQWNPLSWRVYACLTSSHIVNWKRRNLRPTLVNPARPPVPLILFFHPAQHYLTDASANHSRHTSWHWECVPAHLSTPHSNRYHYHRLFQPLWAFQAVVSQSPINLQCNELSFMDSARIRSPRVHSSSTLLKFT